MKATLQLTHSDTCFVQAGLEALRGNILARKPQGEADADLLSRINHIEEMIKQADRVELVRFGAGFVGSAGPRKEG